MKSEESSSNQLPTRTRRVATIAWIAFGALALIVGFLVDAPSLIQSWIQRTTPALELAYFQTEPDGTLRIVSFSNIELTVEPEDIEASRLRLPLNLAVRNLEAAELRDAKVIVSYPSGLTVDPEGSPLIDPTARTLTYEHEVRDLSSIDEFTPLDTIDTVFVEFNYVVVPSVVLTRDLVPLYLILIAGFDGAFQDKRLALGVRIEIPDRPPIEGTMNFTVKAGVEILGLERAPDAETMPAGSEDSRWFAFEYSPEIVVDSWERVWSRGGADRHALRYEKHVDGVASYQRVAVDGVVRRVIIDQDGDSFSDVELVDYTGDGIPDARVNGGHTFMPDWPAAAAE